MAPCAVQLESILINELLYLFILRDQQNVNRRFDDIFRQSIPQWNKNLNILLMAKRFDILKRELHNV